MISAIITTYKREPSLVARAVNSILCQTYKDLEIIIVDDSPADYPYRKDVEETVKEYIKDNPNIDIKYIQHESNRGACAARNTGMNNSNGEYIAFLDDDDEWVPTKLEKQIKVILSTDAALVYCGSINTNDLTGISTEKKTEYYRGNVFEPLIYHNFIDSTSIPLIKSDCLKEIGGFDEQMQSAQDMDVWLRLAEKYTIDYVPEALIIYHEHEGEQITNNPIKKINGLERLNQKYKKYLDKNIYLWYRRNIIITPYYALAGEKKKAFKTWITCVCKCPLEIDSNLRYLKAILFMKKKEAHEKR